MPEQVSLQGTLAVGQGPDGQTVLIVDVGGGWTYVVPFPDDAAKKIGQALLAPRVVRPDAVIQPNGTG